VLRILNHREAPSAPPRASTARCEHCHSGLVGYGAANLGRVRGYGIRRCPACELTFVWPKPSDSELAALYATYHENTGQHLLNSEGETELFTHVVARLIDAVGPSGSLLDIGSSYGHFLALARARGFSTKGLEIASGPARSAREQLGLDIEEVTLEERAFPSGAFTAVTLLNVLEHVPDPLATLQEAFRVARPGGVLIVVVPNLLFAYPYFRVTRRLGLELPVPTSAYDVPFHLTLFSPRSLRTLLAAAGWQVTAIGDAPVIRNRSVIRNLMKRSTWLASRLLSAASGNALLLGYSQLAVARKPSAGLSGLPA
jgi:2-polyprenyl-3-methyl-5-hydroxy-6-metoxy-1,4-benzoquinol methylase